MSDLPSWAVAAGTLALAGVTAWMAWKTRDVADATRQAARAAADEAKASAATVEEIRRDRELSWLPYLLIDPTKFSGSGGGPHLTFVGPVKNLGRGPALNCFHAYIAGGKWYRCPIFGVAPGEHFTVQSSVQKLPIQGAMFTYGQSAINDVHLVICNDGLGDKLYRFVGGRAGFDVWRKQDPKPAWADAALHVEPQLAPK